MSMIPEEIKQNKKNVKNKIMPFNGAKNSEIKMKDSAYTVVE